MGIDVEMFVRTEMSEEEAYKLGVDLEQAFGKRFSWPIFYKPPEPAFLDLSRGYEGDNDLKDGEPIVLLHIAHRYWGPAYQRGDIVFFLDLAKWLETRTGCEVWYGGDAWPGCMVKMTQRRRDILWDCFVNDTRYDDQWWED